MYELIGLAVLIGLPVVIVAVITVLFDHTSGPDNR